MSRKQHYEKNKDAEKLSRKQHYEKNKDAEKESRKLHYEKNKESSKSYHKQYYREHKYSLISKMNKTVKVWHTNGNCCMVTLGMQNLSSSMQEITMPGTGLIP